MKLLRSGNITEAAKEWTSAEDSRQRKFRTTGFQMIGLAFVYTAWTPLLLITQVNISQAFSLLIRNPPNAQEAVFQVAFYYQNIPKNDQDYAQ